MKYVLCFLSQISKEEINHLSSTKDVLLRSHRNNMRPETFEPSTDIPSLADKVFLITGGEIPALRLRTYRYKCHADRAGQRSALQQSVILVEPEKPRPTSSHQQRALRTLLPSTWLSLSATIQLLHPSRMPPRIVLSKS